LSNDQQNYPYIVITNKNHREQLKHFPLSTGSTIIINQKIKRNEKKKLIIFSSIYFFLSRLLICPFFNDFEMHEFDENISKSHKKMNNKKKQQQTFIYSVMLKTLVNTN